MKRALRGTQRYDLIMLDAFDHEYIPEHLLTQEFLQEVKSLLAPRRRARGQHVLVERPVRPRVGDVRRGVRQFFNLKRDNRVIVARLGALPDAAQLRATARPFVDAFDAFGVDAAELLPLFTQRAGLGSARARADRSVFAGESAQSRALISVRAPAARADPVR